MESDFKSETFKIFCGKFLMILKHINPLIDWNGPVKCQNLFWTVWHKIFKSPVKQVWGSNKSCRWWFCQWALQIHYICPTESIQQCDLISTPFFMFSTDLRRSPLQWHCYCILDPMHCNAMVPVGIRSGLTKRTFSQQGTG